jgi:hypothetical protein
MPGFKFLHLLIHRCSTLQGWQCARCRWGSPVRDQCDIQDPETSELLSTSVTVRMIPSPKNLVQTCTIFRLARPGYALQVLNHYLSCAVYNRRCYSVHRRRAWLSRTLVVAKYPSTPRRDRTLLNSPPFHSANAQTSRGDMRYSIQNHFTVSDLLK